MLLAGGRLTIAPESLKRVKDRIREITRRKRGVSLEWMISELNSHLSGWVTYFLGYSFWVAAGKVVKRRVSKKALTKFKERVRQITSRSGGRSLQQVPLCQREGAPTTVG